MDTVADSVWGIAHRRRLTLDLFTRHGVFWEDIEGLRATYQVSARACVPPQPTFRAEVVGLAGYWEMPYQFHIPLFTPYALDDLGKIPEWAEEAWLHALHIWLRANDEWQRNRTAGFLGHLEALWKCNIADGVRSGTDATGWMPWLPFLSACVLYDPPAADLLAFAAHDDVDTASVERTNDLRRRTFSRDPETFSEAERHNARFVIGGGEADRQAAIAIYRESLQPSILAPFPARQRGKPPLDDLEAVQAALWERQGLDYLDIAERGGWHGHDESTDSRKRKNPAISRVKRGKAILHCREYSG